MRALLVASVAALALVVGAGTAAAYAIGEPGNGALDDPDAVWRTSTDPVEVTGLTWLVGTTVHLPDGRTFELDAPTESYVVAGDGVYWIAEEADGSQVRFTSADGETTDTGLDLYADSLQASPDGRYLAGVDTSLDGTLLWGTPEPTVVVLDLHTGEEVVRSTEGMAIDDFFADAEWIYSEAELGGLAFEGDEVHADTLDGVRAWDLETGESRPLEGTSVSAPFIDEADPDSPDGEWRIVESRGLADTLRSAVGDRSVTPSTGTDRRLLWAWVDDRTVIGSAIEGPGGDRRISPADTQTLITCTVPTGACETYEETPGQTVLFPRNSTRINGGFVLSDGTG